MKKQLNKKQQEIYKWLKNRKGYLKKSTDTIWGVYDPSGVTKWSDVDIALKQASIDFKRVFKKSKGKVLSTLRPALNQVKKVKIKDLGIKRLFFDIETSPNIVYSWNIGYNLVIGHDNIIDERSVICICYKWEGDPKVYKMTWEEGDDTSMIYQFFEIIQEADEVVGHNGDNFDIKWFKTRAIYHGIESMPEFKSIDTLKSARKNFRFNSNKLDYIAKFLGLGAKTSTGGFELWKRVITGETEALNTMTDYCCNDVVLLEKVYNKLKGYTKPKTHIGLAKGGSKCDCPSCGSTHMHSRGTTISASGLKKKRLQCQDCGSWHSVSEAQFSKKE